MNPRLRVALVLTPLLSLGVLSCLPSLYLHFARRSDKIRPSDPIMMLLSTVCLGILLATSPSDSPLRTLATCLWCFKAVLATVTVWFYTRAEFIVPEPDPYA